MAIPFMENIVKSTASGVYYTYVDRIGTGSVNRLCVTGDLNTLLSQIKIKIIVDGVEYLHDISSIPASRGFKHGTTDNAFMPRNSFDSFLNMRFNSSIRIEVMQNSSSLKEVHLALDGVLE